MLLPFRNTNLYILILEKNVIYLLVNSLYEYLQNVLLLFEIFLHIKRKLNKNVFKFMATCSKFVMQRTISLTLQSSWVYLYYNI